MQFIEADVKVPADGQHDIGQQGGSVGIEQVIKRPSESIIA